MRIEIFVSRAFNGRVRTRKLYASETRPDDGIDDSLFFYSAHFQPPVKRESALFRDDHTLEPVVHLELFGADHDELPTMWVQFRLDSDHDSTVMTKRELLEYLEHGVDWE